MRNDLKYDDGTVIHACVGDRMVSSDHGTFIVWTLCDKDVPANKSFTGDGVINCAGCLAAKPTPPASEMNTTSIDYWQRKGHALHLVTQRNQPYGSVRRCCEICGIMVWPQMQGEDTPEYTDDSSQYDVSKYRCGLFKSGQQPAINNGEQKS